MSQEEPRDNEEENPDPDHLEASGDIVSVPEIDEPAGRIDQVSRILS